jgi:hypothetical protein
MSSFNEENTVEQIVLDTLCGSVSGNMVAEILDFLKELLTLAKEVVQAEQQVDPLDE